MSAVREQRRFVGPRQYAPRGFREGAARAPMTKEMGIECGNLAKAAYRTKNYGDAVTLYDRALSVQRETLGPIHVDCAATLHNLGRVFLEMKEFGAAENALTEAAAIYEQLEGNKSLKYAESLELLALAYTNLKFFDEAEKAFKESIKIFRDVCYNHVGNSWIPDSPPTSLAEPHKDPLASAAHALADCANLFLMRRMENEAIVFLEEALEIRRYLYTRHHKYRPMIAQTLNKLGELKKLNGDSTGAELCLNECLNICIESFGRDHPATAQATSSKAGVMSMRKNFREAMRLYEESSTTYAAVLGRDSPLFGQELVKLARAQELCGEYELAEKTYVRGIDLVTQCFGVESRQVAEANTFLASLLLRRLDVDRAIDLFRAAMQARKKMDPKDPQLAYVYKQLAEAYALKRETHAEVYFLMAIEAFQENAKVEPLQRTYMTDVLDDLGLFYLDFQHYEKAEKCFKESLDTRIEMLGETHATIAYSYSNFALLYLHRQQLDECEKMCLSSLDMYAKTARSNALAQADVYSTLGSCYQQQPKTRLEEAIKWHEKALNVRRTRGENSEMSVAESLNNLARCLVAKKTYGKAWRYVAEAKRILSKFNKSLTETLRGEVARTEETFPPLEEWPEAERAEAALPLPPGRQHTHSAA